GPEHCVDRRRGTESGSPDTRADSAPFELRDSHQQAVADSAGGATGAQEPTESPRAPATQTAYRIALPDPCADSGRDAKLHPDPPTDCGCARSRAFRGLGGGPDIGVFGRDTAADQYRMRSLPPVWLRRPETADRSARGRSGDQVP